MEYGLAQLFELLNEERAISVTIRRRPPDRVCQRGLFDETEPVSGEFADNRLVLAADIAIIAGLHASAGLDLSLLPESARRLFELSVNAFDALVHAWMSEPPVDAVIIRFGRKVLTAAALETDGPEAERRAADRAAADRGDPDTQTVLRAAYKVWHEIHRLTGFLRFSPDERGVYIARCAPDHFALPALCEHFTQRFGDAPWIIIDEKRRLCLRRLAGESPALLGLDELPQDAAGPRSSSAEWENLWRQYHKTINNESRNNPGLQKRFMPKRYWKYLTEL